MGCATGGSATGCINGDGVDITGTVSTPGGGGGGGSGGSGGGNPDGGDPLYPDVIFKCMARVCDDDPDPAVTLTDIATFHATPGTQRMEPDGWTVPGLETNFYALTRTHVVTGTLLGRPAAVRFTPVGFHWDYGDGARVTRGTAGGSWASRGQHEFEHTPTSHRYTRDGDYTIRLVIDFAAEYRFDGSVFHPISGVIPLRANDLRITVQGATTVLVERDCEVDPTGPGC
jgi:hypothetical protein